MGRPREHDGTVRLALLEAAERLVDEQGAAALSARNVADAAATTTRAVYSVFGSMTGLLEALAIRLFELLDEALDAVVLTDDPRADVIHASIDGFRRVALAHAPLYNLVFLRVVPDITLGPEFHAVANATFGRLESLVKRLAPSGRRRPTTLELTLTVHALTEGLANMELRGALGPPTEAEHIWRAALTALLASASPTSAADHHQGSTQTSAMKSPLGPNVTASTPASDRTSRLVE